MLKKIKNIFSPVVIIIFISIIGFIIGVLTVSFNQKNWFMDEGILNKEFIRKIDEVNIDKRALFFLCFGRRIRAFFLLFLLSFSTVNFVTILFFFLMAGIYVGSVMELLAVQYGMQGIMLYFTMILPQGVLYLIGFGILGCWCLNQDRVQSSLKDRKREKIRNLNHKKALVFSFVFIIIGIILESYVNPKIFFFFI